MPGSAVLDPTNLVDDLLEVIDDVRGDLHPALGVRQYRVFAVLRTWMGEERGAEGGFAEVETEFLPQPLVESYVETMGGKLLAGGLDEAGIVRLRELSLTYTAAEIAGPALARNQEWLIRVRDAYGQGEPVRDFVVKSTYPDRLKDIGWTVSLARASDAEAT